MDTATIQDIQKMEKEYPIHKAPFQSNNKKQTRGRIAARSNIQSIPMYQEVNSFLSPVFITKVLIGYRHIQHKR